MAKERFHSERIITKRRSWTEIYDRNAVGDNCIGVIYDEDMALRIITALNTAPSPTVVK